eukprot:m.79396 g.79396  ORF g.79396 m.79396 type:complete len:484 (+) comp16269_c0_seq2:298-1749(+)
MEANPRRELFTMAAPLLTSTSRERSFRGHLGKNIVKSIVGRQQQHLRRTRILHPNAKGLAKSLTLCDAVSIHADGGELMSMARYKDNVVIATEDGQLIDVVMDADSKKFKVSHDGYPAFNGSQAAVYDMEFLDKGKLAVAGTQGYCTFIDSRPDGSKTTLFKCVGHNLSQTCGTIKSVASMHGNPFVFATSGRDGAIRIWDTRNVTFNMQEPSTGANIPYMLPAQSILRAHAGCTPGAFEHSVTAVKFLYDNHTLASGGADGMVKLWDIRRGYTTAHRSPTPYHVLPTAPGTSNFGVTSLSLDSSGTSLLVSHWNHTLALHRGVSFMNNGHPQLLRGHRTGNFSIRATLSDDGRFALCGSEDGKFYIWDVSQGEHGMANPWSVLAHANDVFVLAIDWYTDAHGVPKLISMDDCDGIRLFDTAPQLMSDSSGSKLEVQEEGVALPERVSPPTPLQNLRLLSSMRRGRSNRLDDYFHRLGELAMH